MPYSKSTFDEQIAGIVRERQPRSVLDIGAGNGKMALLCRSNVDDVWIKGIEIHEPYIQQFNLREIYDEVICGGAMDLFDDVDAKYDCVILGDVIEHLRKSDGVDLIHFLYYRAKTIICKFPIDFVQGAAGSNRYEAHLSNWQPSDFDWCRASCYREKKMVLAVIDGLAR